jgi:hypothetical protein
MKTLIVFCARGISALVCASTLLLGGCGAKDQAPAKASPPTPAPVQSPTGGKIQAALTELRSLPCEPDPAKRPLILSTRAADRKIWLLHTLDQGYAQSAHANSKWDAQVHAAFDAYADYTRAGAFNRYSNLTQAVTNALTAGCDDPMIQYLQTRYNLDDRGAGKEEVTADYLKAFRALTESRYHPLLKFMAGYRASQATRSALTNFDGGALLTLVIFSLQDLARDTNAPVQEVFEPAMLWLQYGYGQKWWDRILSDVKPLLEKNWGHEEPFYALCGWSEVSLAWAERGGGFANTVTEKGWTGFRMHLDKAESLLKTAWTMNPSNAQTAYMMMQVELGQGQGRPRMQQWFGRAMALFTNNYDAAKLMSFYLEPRWYGSEETALEFARTCVTSTNWGGAVPLVLPQVHHSLAGYFNRAESPEYWHRSEVWDDIRSAYEKFYKLNPEDVSYRHNYALDAYLCGKYAQFLAQAKLFSTGTNYSYFGGEAKFKEMLARASAAKAP